MLVQESATSLTRPAHFERRLAPGCHLALVLNRTLILEPISVCRSILHIDFVPFTNWIVVRPGHSSRLDAEANRLGSQVDVSSVSND
jgi:hypothetical protein